MTDRPYSQSLDLIFRDDAAGAGIKRAALEPALEKLAPALTNLKTAHDDGSMPFLTVPAWRDDLVSARTALETLMRGANDIILFGTGGSSLGGQAIAQISGWRTPGYDLRGDGVRLHVLDNLDAGAMSALLGGLDLKQARFIVISKSGSTPETVMQMLSAIDALTQAGLDWNLNQHFLVVTTSDTVDNEHALGALCRFHNISVLDHHPGIGGRYSALSIVGILPAMVVGLDPHALREGAQGVVDKLISGGRAGDFEPALGAAVQWTLMRERNLTSSVLMPYADRLRGLASWFAQLWAESLGKGGKGTTPIASAGPVDQHSQLQLFLDGPNDKFFTLIVTDTAGTGPVMPQALAKDANLGYLAGKTIGDLIDGEQRATAETLARNGRFVRLLTIETLDERAVGALMMHYMIETVLMAHLLDVDPFDQPAVEESKQLTRAFLSATRD